MSELKSIRENVDVTESCQTYTEEKYEEKDQ